MPEFIPCPNKGCKNGKIHLFVDFDIFWSNFQLQGIGIHCKKCLETASKNSKRD